MNFVPTDKPTDILAFRKQLYAKLTSPIDAMWELLYIASAQDYLIVKGNQKVGYCCIDSDKSLLQLFLLDQHLQSMNEVVKSLIELDLVARASLSSSEPIAFTHCLFHAQSISTNTFCFAHPNKTMDLDHTLNLQPVTEKEIPAIKGFLKQEVGMDDTFGYTQNLVHRGEIFRAMEGETILATSECRLSDSQPAYADVGMIVNSRYRGRGLATEILKWQVNRILALGRKPICSTTLDNKASQKAIKKAGFYCSNIIFDIQFTTPKSPTT